MKKFAVLAVLATVMLGVSVALATREKDEPKMPVPQKEHEWLKQLEGEWEHEAEMIMEPGKPAMKSKGTEKIRSLGGFWSVSEITLDHGGTPMTGIMTIGYDPKTKKYVGTWVCSMCDWLCKYEGSLSDGKLTLNCEGPNPSTGKTAQMRDVIELKGKDEKVLTSYLQTEDGKWVQFMTMKSKRKK